MVEFSLDGTNYITCPSPEEGRLLTLSVVDTGYNGTVWCPAAASFCSPELNIMPTAPTWFTAPGSDLEYGIVTATATRSQAADACASYSPAANSALAYIPGNAIAKFVRAAQTINAPVWIGARSGGSWLENYGHSIASRVLGYGPFTTECNHLGTDGVLRTESCTTKLAFICSRRQQATWFSTPPKGMAAFGAPIVHPTSNYRYSHIYYAPDPTAYPPTSAAVAKTYCDDGAGGYSRLFEIENRIPTTDSLFLLNSITEAAGVNVLKLDASTPGYWTDATWSQGDSTPWYANIIVGGLPTTSPVRVCFLIGRPDATEPTKVLYPIECTYSFPALCSARNVPVYLSTLLGQTMRLTQVLAPSTRADAQAICSALGQKLLPVRNARVSAVVSFYMNYTARLVSVNPALTAAHVSGYYNLATLMMEFDDLSAAYPDPPSVKTTSYYPRTGLAGMQNGAKQLATAPFAYAGVSSTTERLPFFCASLYVLDAPGGTCANGTWCWDVTTDHRLAFITAPLVSTTNASAACATMGGEVGYHPPLPTNYDSVMSRLLGNDREFLNAFVTGMRVDGTKLRAIDDNSIIPDLDISDTSRFLFAPVDGDCIWGTRTTIGGTDAIALVPQPCGMPGPLLCKQPLATRWVPYRTSIVENKWDYEYTVSAEAMTRDAAQQQCNSSDGTLAFFRYTVATGKLEVGDVFSQLLIEDPNINFWFGMEVNYTVDWDFFTPHYSSGLYQQDFYNTFADFQPGRDIPPELYACFTVRHDSAGKATYKYQASCSAPFRALCIRSRQVATHALPADVYAGTQPSASANNRIAYELPTTSATTSNSIASAQLVVSATANLTGLHVQQTSFFKNYASSGNPDANKAGITVDCAGVTGPTIVTYSFSVVSTTASIRRNVMNYTLTSPRVSTVWPCMSLAVQQPTASVRGLTAGQLVNYTVRMDKLVKPDSYVDVIVDTGSPDFVCSPSQFRLTAPANLTSTSHLATIRCLSSIAGVPYRPRLTIDRCNPTQLCQAAGTELAVMSDVQYLLPAAITASVTTTGLYAGADNEYSGSLALVRASPVKLKIRLLTNSSSMLISQALWRNVSSTVPLRFTFATATTETAVLDVSVELEDHESWAAAELIRLLPYGLFRVATLTFAPTFPVSIVVSTPYVDAGGVTRLYAGQLFWVDFVVDAAAFDRDASTSLVVGLVERPELYVRTNASVTTTTLTLRRPTRSDPCCTFRMSLVALPNISGLVSSPPSDVTTIAGVSSLVTLPLLSTTGPYAKSLPMPPPSSLLLEFRAVKTVDVVASVERVFAGGPADSVILSLPQTPAGTDVVLSFSCVTEHLRVTPASVRWAANEWANFEPNRVFQVSSPKASNKILDGDRPFTCTFSVTRGNDVASSLTALQIIVSPQAKITMTTLPPASALPGAAFNVALRIDISRFASSLPTTSPSITFAGATIRSNPNLSDEYVDGSKAILRNYLVTVGSSAQSSESACISFNVSDTTHYQTPDLACFAVLPRIVVEIAFDKPLSTSQPVGPTSPQSFSIALSSVPIAVPITIELDCIRTKFSGAVNESIPIAAFEPARLSWAGETLGSGSITRKGAARKSKLIGLLEDQICQPAYRIVNTDGDLRLNQQMQGSSSLTALVPDNVVFAHLLYVTYSVQGLRDALYVGNGTLGNIIIALPRAPSSMVTVRCVLAGATDSQGTLVTVDRPSLTFNSTARELQDKFVLRAFRRPNDDADVSFTLVMETTAGEFYPLIMNTSYAFKVRQPISLLLTDTKLAKPISDTYSLYCGGQATAGLIRIDIPYSPVNLRSPVQISFETNASTLSASPSTQLFGPDAWETNARSALFSVSCANVANVTPALWTVVTTAPPEFRPRQSITVIQKPLEGFVVSGRFTKLPVGAVLAFAIRPVLVPSKDTLLKLRFTTTCGNSIAIRDNGLPFSIEWTGNAGTRTVPLMGMKPVLGCIIRLVADPTSTAPIFAYEAMRQVVDVIDLPRVSPILERAPQQLDVADLDAGVDLVFTVVNAQFDTENTLSADMYSNRAASSACVLLQARGGSDDSQTSFIFRYGRDNSAVTVSANADGALVVRVKANLVGKRVSEAVTISFTKFCFLTTTEAPAVVDPKPGYENFTFTIVPPVPALAVANNVVSSVALGFSLLGASPAMGSSIVKLSFLGQTKCDLAAVEKPGTRELNTFENIFNVPVGPVDDLGVMLGAAIFNTVLMLGFFSVHAFLTFFTYAFRRDYAVEDRSLRRSAALLRFPALGLTVVLFYCPLVAEFSLRVTLYSSNLAMRIVAGCLFGTVVVGGVSATCFMVYKSASRAQFAWEPPKDMPWYKRAYRIRGKWSAVDVDRLMYGVFYDDFTDRWRYYNAMELVIATLIAVAAAIEPSSKGGCTIKVGFICGLFAANFLVVAVVRPFRRHVANAFFLVITLAFTAASSVALSGLTGDANELMEQGALVSIQVIGNMLLIKAFIDLCSMIYELALKKVMQRNKLAVRKDVHFKVIHDPMSQEDLFPYLKQQKRGPQHDAANVGNDEALLGDEEDADDDAVLQLPTTRRGAPVLSAREVEERKRAAELMDLI
jgi:hypothetical protein